MAPPLNQLFAQPETVAAAAAPQAWFFDPLPRHSWDLISVDCPWSFRTWSQNGKKYKSPEGHYRTMKIEDIRAMPVLSLAHRNCVLWCWATHPMIDQQIQIVRDWGFTFVTTGVWVKRTVNGKLGFGTGYRLRCASEPFIIATVGRPLTERNVRTVIEGQVREHSRKPNEAYAAAEKLLPRTMWGTARRADIFSRESRPGWSAWGDQMALFDREE